MERWDGRSRGENSMQIIMLWQDAIGVNFDAIAEGTAMEELGSNDDR